MVSAKESQMETTSLLFALLRNVVCGEERNEEVKTSCTQENLEKVYLLAQKHDLAHLVAHAVEDLEIPECETLAKLKKAKMTALYRYIRLDYELARICDVLEKGNIPFIPLKGSVLRAFYPEPWMRSSCDIDVLVKPENLWDAVLQLEKEGYQRKGKSQHDVSLYAPSGVHLELHYGLIEERDPLKVQNILNRVWERADRKADTGSHYLMADDMFYVYHIAHMASHFLRGGCGIRSCLDVWILQNYVPGNPEARNALLEQSGLLAFAKAVEKLSFCWFSNVPRDMETIRLENYLLYGGTYGNSSNGAVVQRAADTGARIPFHRILIPFSDLRYAYPVLDQKPWLAPLCQVLRWFRLMGILRRLLKKRVAARKVSHKAESEMQLILQYLEL